MINTPTYVTLPSNCATNLSNTPSKFTVRLARKLELPGTWVCGLYSLSYRHSWHSLGSVQGQHIDVYLKENTEKTRIPIPPGSFSTTQQLAAALNDAITRTLGDRKKRSIRRRRSTGQRYVQVSYMTEGDIVPRIGYRLENGSITATPIEYGALPDRAVVVNGAVEAVHVLGQGLLPRQDYEEKLKNGEFEVENSPTVIVDYREHEARYRFTMSAGVKHIALSPQLSYMLGFKEGSKVRSGDAAHYPADLLGGTSHLCVYARGLVEDVIFGDTLDSLLRVVTVEGVPGKSVEVIYDSPILLKVTASELNSIDIEIRDLQGRLVNFMYGNLIVTLVFKRVLAL